jgi:hypothetical protein
MADPDDFVTFSRPFPQWSQMMNNTRQTSEIVDFVRNDVPLLPNFGGTALGLGRGGPLQQALAGESHVQATNLCNNFG